MAERTAGRTTVAPAMQPREWLLVGLLGAAFAPALVACGLMLALGALLRRLEKPR